MIFLPLTEVCGDLAKGYTEERVRHLPVTCNCLPGSPDAERRHFYYKMSLQIFVAVFLTEFPFPLYACVFFFFFLILLFNMWVESVRLTHTLLPHFPSNSCRRNSNDPSLALKALCNQISLIHYSFILMFTYSLFSLNLFLLSIYYVCSIMIEVETQE